VSAPRGRILQVFPYHLAEETGGASGVRTVIESTIALADEWEHVVLVPGPSPFSASFEQLGAEVRSLGRREHLIVRRGSSVPALLHHAARLLVDVPRIGKMIVRDRIDIVHSHSSAYLGAVLAARLTGRPAVVHIHERLDAVQPNRAHLYRRLVALLASRVIVIAEFMRAEWVDCGARVVYVPNTARCGERAHATRGEPVIGFVGRVAPRKGIEYLLRAFALVRVRLPEARLVVVGGPAEPEDYPYLESLRSEVRALGLEESVVFAGPTGDVPAAMDGFRVLGFASPVDIAPITILEAMADGLPVVSASDGGAEEMVVDGETGFAVAPRDTAALADGLERVLEDGDLRLRLGAAARRRFDAVYGPARYAESIQAVYADLVRKR